VVGVDELPTQSSYFVGSDPTPWRTHIANYAKVRYTDIYPGIDLAYYGTSDVFSSVRAAAHSETCSESPPRG